MIKITPSVTLLILLSLAPDVLADTVSQLSIGSLLHQADWVVKSVMAVLLAASVVCWSVFFVKSVELRSALYRTNRLAAEFKKVSSFSQQITATEDAREYALLTQAKEEYDWAIDHDGDDEKAKGRVAERLNSSITVLTSSRLHGTGILASVGAVAPFVGLFGTVWGIMNSFIGIAETSTTNLAVVAPGIAEALLATAFGLLAAIPAVVFYNYLSRRINAYRKKLTAISADILLAVGRQLELHNQMKTIASGTGRSEPVVMAAKG